MHQCARCGHALGVGRYCVNCGQPRDDIAGPPDVTGDVTGGDPTSTAERPAVRVEDSPAPSDPARSPWPPGAGPTAPPPVYETPGRPRYPMYADDPPPPPATPATPLPPVAPVAPVSPEVWEADTSVPVAFVGYDDHAAPTDDRRSHAARRSALPWLVVAAALVLVAGMGVFLLRGNDTDDDRAGDPAPGGSASASAPGTSAPTTDPSSSEPTSPTTSTTTGPSKDVSGSATVRAPSTAKPGVDVDGNPVRYDAANMLDDRPDTAWRAPGSAAGSTLVFTLAKSTRLTSVGLLNGYAKRDPGYDGYTANRRVLEVEWVFDGGETVTQTLGESRAVQKMRVDVVSRTVRMRLVSVSDPARAPKGRNFTAISTVELLGSPQP
ncbi:discoidin domain-containing protein [Nocardioides plantarum]|uniref:Discoidin domain-containing protein n=1 Tax=Nocardioides plantarum TaxID=29299 RepID=A0ABV5KDZ0_9ACTN|nr:discoidin domain-containing protein [Nocardioides plantarum]